MNIIGGKMRNKICRWMVDAENENMINSAQVSYISFEDKGEGCDKRFRLIAHTEHADFLLYEHDAVNRVKAMFWVYFANLNLIDVEKHKNLQEMMKEVEDEFPEPEKVASNLPMYPYIGDI